MRKEFNRKPLYQKQNVFFNKRQHCQNVIKLLLKSKFIIMINFVSSNGIQPIRYYNNEPLKGIYSQINDEYSV